MKKLFLLLTSILVIVLIWYLFIKKYDYQFETTAKYGPGAVAYELLEWRNFQNGSNPASGNFHNDDFNSIIQKFGIQNGDSIEFAWELERLNDSSTAITVKVLSEKNRLANRIAIANPFQKSQYIDSLKQKLLNFKKELRQQQELYRIIPADELVESPHMDCVCSSSHNIPLTRKATEMMATISSLENYILSNKITLNGYPFLKVTNWDRKNDIIDFDFCFPIEKKEGLREAPNLTLKTYPSQRSLNVTFNGNYRISHISWFDLLSRAREKQLEVTGGPLEVYHDNPKIDNDELNWRAEIYLPVK